MHVKEITEYDTLYSVSLNDASGHSAAHLSHQVFWLLEQHLKSQARLEAFRERLQNMKKQIMIPVEELISVTGIMR